ncbi:LysR family transcriptional regulator [Ramlibacter monticola]|uniref:LysR family transcriptional regulator n=1 Tax=Ramlibacter monticola TaxID=1926872 RepID=A0A936Z7Q6_9BURK|nr:LysR substrate-binding domain-containing protein [Ramlibacter monticola]MBL0395247.1 LysR family transcriptional regulator [Ramlibacter monticola]
MRRKLPSTQTLACFEAAARHRSLTRAAQELALTQGAVSRQLGQLEEFLGVKLFKRAQHGIALTPAGDDYARKVQLRLDAIERDALDLMGRQGQGESVTLAAVPTFATRWLIPRLARLAREQPDLNVHIAARTRPFLFAENEFDGAIYAGTPQQLEQWAGTHATLLLQEEVAPVCSPALLKGGQPVTPRALANLPLLQQSTRPDAWRDWFTAQSVEAPKAMAGPRYELFSMQVAAASCGMGVALVPTLLIQGELAAKTLVPACESGAIARRAYYLVQPEQPERAAVTVFRKWLLKEAGRP